MSISSDLGPEASTACIASVYGREDSLGPLVPCSPPSRIPLPKCLVESSVRLGRSRIELRNRNLAGVEPSKVGICKPESQENDLSPLYSKSEPRTLFTAARMRGNGDVAVQAALTPISVNAFNATDGQSGGSMTERITQHTPASQFQESTHSSRLGQSISNSKSPIKNERREWIEDGGPCELNTGQTLVWSNAVFGADKPNGEQSPCIEPHSSIHCVPSNSTHTASNETAFVSDPSSSRFILCRHGGEMLSPEELPSLCKRSNTRKLVESTRLSTSEVLAGDRTFIKISNNGCYLENDAGCTMNSFSKSHSCDEEHRTRSMSKELEDAHLSLGGTKYELHMDQPQDFMSTKKNLFDASLLEEEDSDLVTFQPVLANNSLFTQCCEELHTADTSSMSANFEDTTEPENLYIVHNCREFHKEQSPFQPLFPHHALRHYTRESLEAQLEDDIQTDIEDEISKEILHLSQKLANLQARHGAQRTLDGSLPAVLSCPVTPVLTPRIRQRKADACSKKQDGIGDDGCRHKRGRVVAAKVFQGTANRTSEPGTSENNQQGRPVFGRGCPIALNVQKVTRKENLGRRCSSLNSNAATHGCASSSENGQHAAQEEHGDNSLAGTPSSGSIRSNVTDFTLNKRKARTLRVGVTRPQVFPDNSRRFEWVKSLRSGETGIRGSPGSAVSKQPLKLPTPRKELGEDSESESKNRLHSAKQKREALLADMARELKTRLNELAIRTTPDSAQIPAVQDMQETRSVGRVVASRYAGSSEPGVNKDPEGSIPKDASEGYGCLDKRTAVHLMKAGLTRGLTAGKKQGSYSKSNVVNSEVLQGEKVKRKSVGTQHSNTDPDQPFLDKDGSGDRPEQTAHTWSEMKETFETEYETFVEGPSDDPKISDLLNVTKDLQEHTPKKLATIQSSQGSPPGERSTTLSTSKGSAMRSKSKRQPIKRTYIRCIEVVVDQPGANRSTSAANQNLFTTQSQISESNKKFELEVLEGSLFPSSKSVATASKDGHLNLQMTDANHLPAISLHEKLATSSKVEEPTSVKTRHEPLRTVFKLHGKIRREEGYVQDKSPGPCELQGGAFVVKSVITTVTSCDEECKTKVTAAEKPLLSSLRERWEELIDALEKERQRLPKIKTETGNVIVSSPRDSGCVKRNTERLKSMEHFSPENLIPNGLQGRSEDPVDENLGVASEFIKSCIENEPKICAGAARGTTPTQRTLQPHRKGALHAHTKLTRRHWKMPQSTHKQGKSTGNPRKFITNKSPTPQSDIESFDLESFWCLVRESEDHVQTAHPPSAAVR